METAILNASLKETVHIKIPKGCELVRNGQVDNIVLKLNRELYGLVKAPKARIEEFIKSLIELRCNRS